MEFNEALAKDDNLRKVSEVMASSFNIPLDTMLTFAKVWFNKGQFDARVEAMEERLSAGD